MRFPLKSINANQRRFSKCIGFLSISGTGKLIAAAVKSAHEVSVAPIRARTPTPLREAK